MYRLEACFFNTLLILKILFPRVASFELVKLNKVTVDYAIYILNPAE